jgi:hypothetical protein
MTCRVLTIESYTNFAALNRILLLDYKFILPKYGINGHDL